MADDQDQQDWMKRFLGKLRELLKGKISDEDYNECVQQARSHVGGMAKAEKARKDKSACTETPLFMAEMQFAEDKRSGSVQIFPKVGRYSHPMYGELDVSEDFLGEVKANFDERVYQQDIPLTIDLEHETKLSGAAGWFRELEQRGKSGLWASIEFTDRGAQLVADGAYRYFSPEYYSVWQDPASGRAFNNVLIGGALTNRPFFKGMTAVVMMGESAWAFTELTDEAGVDAAETSEGESQSALVDDVLAEPTGGEPMGMTEEETRQFTEATEGVKSLTEQVTSLTEQLAASEAARVALESDARRKALTEIVKANRLAFQGETEAAVERLERYQAQLSESDFAEYLDERKAQHKAMSESAAFTQTGHQGETPRTTEGEIEAAVQRLMAEKPELTKAEALGLVFKADPKLYERHNAEFLRNAAKRGGE